MIKQTFFFLCFLEDSDVCPSINDWPATGSFPIISLDVSSDFNWPSTEEVGKSLTALGKGSNEVNVNPGTGFLSLDVKGKLSFRLGDCSS